MLVLGARLQILNSVVIGLFSLNSCISWKGKKFNTKENEWFSTMIALNIHRPEAHLEIRGSNAVGLFACFVFTLTKLPEKNPTKAPHIYFLLGGQKERPGSRRPPRGTLLWEEPPSCAAALEMTAPVRLAPRLSALRSGMAMCRSYGGNRAFSEEKHATCPMLGSRHHVKCPCGHRPVELLGNVKGYMKFSQNCVCVCVICREREWNMREEFCLDICKCLMAPWKIKGSYKI